MYLPAFSFTIIGHNLFEKLAKIKQISTFLEGVTASVVGFIAITSVQLMGVCYCPLLLRGVLVGNADSSRLIGNFIQVCVLYSVVSCRHTIGRAVAGQSCSAKGMLLNSTFVGAVPKIAALQDLLSHSLLILLIVSCEWIKRGSHFRPKLSCCIFNQLHRTTLHYCLNSMFLTTLGISLFAQICFIVCCFCSSNCWSDFVCPWFLNFVYYYFLIYYNCF